MVIEGRTFLLTGMDIHEAIGHIANRISTFGFMHNLNNLTGSGPFFLVTFCDWQGLVTLQVSLLLGIFIF